MTAHTPGPWQRGPYDSDTAIHGGEQQLVAMVATSGRFIAPRDGEANARLIAAAPELLEAARDVLAFEDPDSVVDQQSDPRLGSDQRAALDRLRHAVAKAEGWK